MAKWVSPSDFVPKQNNLNKMPTFGQMTRYLNDLGFTHRTDTFEGRPRHVFEQKASGSLFTFGDRPLNERLPDHIVMPVHYHLTWNGVIEDIPFEQFITQFTPAKAG